MYSLQLNSKYIAMYFIYVTLRNIKLCIFVGVISYRVEVISRFPKSEKNPDLPFPKALWPSIDKSGSRQK